MSGLHESGTSPWSSCPDTPTPLDSSDIIILTFNTNRTFCSDSHSLQRYELVMWRSLPTQSFIRLWKRDNSSSVNAGSVPKKDRYISISKRRMLLVSISGSSLLQFDPVARIFNNTATPSPQQTTVPTQSQPCQPPSTPPPSPPSTPKSSS